jgi:uncharacterized protein (DUF362 family)
VEADKLDQLVIVTMYNVAVVKYSRPYESLKQAVELCGAIGDIRSGSKVCIKPNIVSWYEDVNFPKYGVLTTCRLIEDMVKLLIEHGVTDISIIEGMVGSEQKDKPSILETASRGLGLDLLKNRYGVKIIDVMRGSFAKISVDDKNISVNSDILEADYVVNMPVLKTHTQTMVSLGIKNLKGLLNIASRKMFHSSDQHINLHYYLAKLPGIVPPTLTIIDGIYSLELGPMITGKAHRSDIIIASKDLISADKVGATVLGIEPRDIPHIAFAAEAHGRKTDLSDVNIQGEVNINKLLKPHKWRLEQNESGEMPTYFANAGVKGIRFLAMDDSLCTYGADFYHYIVMGILTAKNKDKTFDDVEILYGRIQEPTPGCKHTMLVGQCQIKSNSEHPAINHCVTVRGCPPRKDDFIVACKEVGIELTDGFLDWMKKSPELVHMKRYKGNPEFDESFYRIE